MIRDLDMLLGRAGHIVKVEARHTQLLGYTFQPVCVEDGCGYTGGHHQTRSRAQAVATEHHLKSADLWTPAW